MSNTTAVNGLFVVRPAQSHDRPQPQCNLHPFLHMFPIYLNLGLRATSKHLPLFNKDPSSQSTDEPTWMMMTGGLVNESERQQE